MNLFYSIILQALKRSVRTDDIEKTMQLVFCGADVSLQYVMVSSLAFKIRQNVHVYNLYGQAGNNVTYFYISFEIDGWTLLGLHTILFVTICALLHVWLYTVSIVDSTSIWPESVIEDTKFQQNCYLLVISNKNYFYPW